MSNWVQRSIEFANGEGYLDNLQSVYPIKSNGLRSISDETIRRIKDAYSRKSNRDLILESLKLDKFPIDDPYVGVLRMNPKLIDKNPETINRIGKMLQSFDLDVLISKARAPKTPSRQMGNSFKKWLRSLGYDFRDTIEFHSTREPDLFFLDGSDKTLKLYVNDKLKLNLNDTKKGIDFVFRKGDKFCIGEAKFITDYGGTQTNQLDVALEIAELNKKQLNIYSAAVLDGVAWFNSGYKDKIKKREQYNIMTSLIFKEFVESF
ncbi:MAG: hypothetical protein QXU18_07640 [Thermoplasmatales archaeon]